MTIATRGGRSDAAATSGSSAQRKGGRTSCLAWSRTSASFSSDHHPCEIIQRRCREMGSLARHLCTSSESRYREESSDVEWWLPR